MARPRTTRPPARTPQPAPPARTVLITHSSDLGVLAGAVLARGLKAKKPELLFASVRTLPETFLQLAGEAPGRCLVLGHRAPKPVEPLLETLTACAQAGWSIEWLGSPQFPDPAWPRLKGTVALYLPPKSTNIVHSALLRADLETDQWVGTLYEASLGSAKPSKDASLARDLAAALVERYWQFEDREAAPDAVRALASGPPFSDEMERAVVVFRRHGAFHLTGKSKIISLLRRTVTMVAQDPFARVLIQGETGTGKEVVARLLHVGSPRADQPFLAVNCATLTGELLLSHLFGHERGAFTGALESHKGLFEQADGGTLFLDEVGELDQRAQAMLLRVLEEGKIRRLGGQRDLEVDVRVLTATHRDLLAMADKGRFRDDLYYRLAQMTLDVPALRDRREDIPFIAQELLFGLWKERKLKGQPPALDAEAQQALKAYPWPGNIRELENLLSRALLLRRLAELPALLAQIPQSSVAPSRPETIGEGAVQGRAHPGIGISPPQPAGDLFASTELPLEELISAYLGWMLKRCGTKAEVMRRAKVSQGRLTRHCHL